MAQSLIPASPFLGGLNTELNKLVDSTDYTQDELNFTIRANNTRSRRLGVDYEELYKFNRELIDTTVPNLAFACTEWTDVNSPDESTQYNTPLIVCQIGGTLIFFRNHGQPFSGDQTDFTLDLKNYALDSAKTDYMTEVCQFSSAYGCLFVSSRAIKPFYLRAAQEDSTVVPEEKPQSTTVFCGIENSKKARAGGDGYWKMYINGLQIGQVTMKEYYGSNWTGRYYENFQLTSTQIAEAWNKIPSEDRFGIIATPKYPDAYPTRWGMRTESGIINEIPKKNTTPDDWVRFDAPDGSGESLKGVEIKLISGAYYKVDSGGSWYDVTFKGTLAGGTVYENSDGLELRIRDTIGVQDYLPVDNSPTKMSYAHLYNLLNQGWTVQLIADYYNAQNPKTFPANNLAQFYLKDQKTEKFKPETIINTTFGNTPAAKGHFVLDFFEQDRLKVSSVKIAMSNLAALLKVTVDDIIDKDVPNWDSPELQIPIVKPRKNFVASSCAYAGRIFYLCGDILLYSQIISEDIVKANKCYSDADPTSEEISDVIETDGGTISLPEIGEGIKLVPVGSYLFVFGTRDVFAIAGTANNIFTATAYSAGGVSAIPSQAPNSFVETEFGVFYWGLSGISLLSAGEDGLQVQDISTSSILTFYGKLTNIQQQHCKGLYSSSRKKVYWFYPSNVNKPRQLDLCLAYDLQRNAFMPFKISSQPIAEDYEGFSNYPEIVSATEIRVPFVESHEYPIYAEIQIPEDIKEVTVYQYKTLLDGAETFVYSKAPFEFYYADKECTQQLGPFEDLYQSGETLVTRRYRNWTRQALGADHVAVGTPWTNSLSLSQEIFIDPSKEALYPSGQKTEAEDPNLYSNVDFQDYVEDFGQISYEFPKLTPETKDQAPVTEYNVTYTGLAGGSQEVIDDEGYKVLADTPQDTEDFTYESSTLLCLDPIQGRVTFGNFRNNALTDWAEGDTTGDGYSYQSYLISHPANAQDFVRNKTMPYLISYFKRTETGKDLTNQWIYGSRCQGSVLWDWRTNGEHSKWDSPQELYRPNLRTIFSEGYIITKTNIRGIGRAFQIKLESVENNQLIIESLCFNLQGDSRI